MNFDGLTKKFEKMGASVSFNEGMARNGISVNIINRKFQITVDDESQLDISIPDVQKDDRHLLMFVKSPDLRPGVKEPPQRYLCGHDERDWFVAAVPESSGASNVREAREALKPRSIREAQKGKLKTKDLNKGRNEVFTRQGEWFFTPVNIKEPEDYEIHKKEEIRRGGGSPHVVEEIYRRGGTTAYACSKYPDGVTQEKYNEIIKRDNGSIQDWKSYTVDAAVFGRGWVRHRDHKTINLPGWHRIEMNTENQAMAMRNVTFLD